MKLTRIKLADIKGSVYQPRSQPDVEIQQVVDSIIKNGLINPIIVREKKQDGDQGTRSALELAINIRIIFWSRSGTASAGSPRRKLGSAL